MNEKYEKKIEKILNAQKDKIKDLIKKEKITLVMNKFFNVNIADYQIDIIIPDEKSSENYEFMLEINLIYNTIHLYSKNIKQFSDCRDLYSTIMINKEIKNDLFNKDDFDLELIIKNIKLFISNLSENIKNSKIIGKYYLTEEYNINFVKGLKNLNQIPCRHIEYIKGKKLITPALCCISNDFFCLYEFGSDANKFLTNDEYKFTLVFYASIDAMISCKKLFEGSVVSISWKKKSGDEFYMKLESDIDSDMNKIIDLLIESMKKSGFKWDIVEKKYGEIPKIDIKGIEDKINNYEIELQKTKKKDVFNNLISTYEQAIVYYSAINDSRYVTYNTRVKELLKDDKYIN